MALAPVLFVKVIVAQYQKTARFAHGVGHCDFCHGLHAGRFKRIHALSSPGIGAQGTSYSGAVSAEDTSASLFPNGFV